MPENGSYKVGQIDHVEMFVPSRYEAAKWYEEILGLSVVREYENWAANPGGPLMISSDGGGTKLALFRGKPPGKRETAGFHRVAFRTDGDGFRAFLARLDEIELFDQQGNRLTREMIADHGQSFSIYFVDPYGHHLEITTYD